MRGPHPKQLISPTSVFFFHAAPTPAWSHTHYGSATCEKYHSPLMLLISNVSLKCFRKSTSAQKASGGRQESSFGGGSDIYLCHTSCLSERGLSLMRPVLLLAWASLSLLPSLSPLTLFFFNEYQKLLAFSQCIRKWSWTRRGHCDISTDITVTHLSKCKCKV